MRPPRMHGAVQERERVLTAGVIAGLCAVVLLAVVVLYNHLVRLRVRADHAWAQVDTQLQRRHDLVPALVSTVSGYAHHERAALDEVMAARASALAVSEPTDRAPHEDALGASLARLLAVSEAYPDLRADENFRLLTAELSSMEDRIAFARGFANDRVARYREAISAFPGLVLARPFGFEDRPMFDTDPHARAAHTIDGEDLR